MNNENVTNQLENNEESMEEHLEGLREFAELHPEMKSHYEDYGIRSVEEAIQHEGRWKRGEIA